jgi:hypothetical protein
VPEFGKNLEDLLAKLDASMIEGHCDPHGSTLPSRRFVDSTP